MKISEVREQVGKVKVVNIWVWAVYENLHYNKIDYLLFEVVSRNREEVELTVVGIHHSRVSKIRVLFAGI